MVYDENPFNSSQGQKILEDIFDLMFVAPVKQPNKIETENKIKQVDYYKSNIVNIVNKMRKFVMGYKQIILSETEGSGILVCPSCYRRDAIWNWETVDAGHYASPKDWLSSVELTEWEQGGVNEKGRYLFMVRYRCNHVTTCNDCGTTWKGHGKSTCPQQVPMTDSNGKIERDGYGNPRMKTCGSSNLAKVGCGEESYGKHFVRLYTADDNIPQQSGQGTGAIERNLKIPDPNNRRLKVDGEITGYEFVHETLPDGKIVRDWEEVKEYTPKIRFTVSNNAVIDPNTGKGVSKTVDCPVSELTFAVSKQQQAQCVFGKRTGMPPNQKQAHPKEVVAVRTSRNDPPYPFECPRCGADDFNPPLQEVYNLYYRPYPMMIKNSQPLGGEAAGGTFRGKPVYNLYLESPVADLFKLFVPIPAEFSLSPIPRKPQIQRSGSAPPSCPNDVGGNLSAEEVMKEVKEELEETLEELRKQATANTTGITPTDADNCTAPGYTFDVCEGRSRKAYYDTALEMWIDDSPPCYSFVNRNDGKTVNTKQQYARWGKIPIEAGGDASEYQGPNPNIQLIQDWLKATKSITAPSGNSPIYHYVHVIDTKIDKDLGTKMEVFECKTCKSIVEAGGCIPYRQANGQCDENGVATGGFPQAVLDAELKYENEYPLVNNLGEPVPIAWGIYAQEDHDGKKMLENPNLNINIG